MRISWPVALALAACGGKHADDDGGWTTRPVRVQRHDVGVATLTIELPDGLEVVTGGGYDLKWEGHKLGDPRGYVLLDDDPLALTLDRTVADADLDAAQLIRRRAIDGGYAVVQASSTFVRAVVWREWSGARSYLCDSAIPAGRARDRAADWAERVCLSVTVAGPPAPAPLDLDALSTDQLASVIDSGAYQVDGADAPRKASLAERAAAARILAARLAVEVDTPPEQVLDRYLEQRDRD
jgi:hypothetical protein